MLWKSACFFENICHLSSANVVKLEQTLFLQYKFKTNFSNLVKSALLGDSSFPNLPKASKTSSGERKSVCQHDFLLNHEISLFGHILKMHENQKVLNDTGFQTFVYLS